MGMHEVNGQGKKSQDVARRTYGRPLSQNTALLLKKDLLGAEGRPSPCSALTSCRVRARLVPHQLLVPVRTAER